ncbi:hypothetical protein [Bradyrhizobium cajani]|uniref:Uncharacterized protein n=1 Tax=Bradyrhizobium cajani TaxID=1928661 RepID=A0A844T7S7_9BRAD|nr:hypothetical protein [Bradyrhizobium cajani]MCP3370874.1 hypothetical protein [Bradyrhizobium cajani]MVT72094.1 hypothetical protein [Bradyrhizobium cajani]
MDEVSESSNTSAPETSAMEVRLAPAGQLQLSSQQGVSSDRDPFDDRILTASSTDGGRALRLKDDGGASTTALDAATPTELRMASDAVSTLGSAQDQGLSITDSSVSHLGDVLQSDPVAAPVFSDSRAPRQTSPSLADRSMAANDVLEPPAPPWQDSGAGAHRASSRGADLGHDAGSTGTSNQSQHAGHPTSPALDVLPLDDILDPAQHHSASDHHNVPANDDAKPAHADASKIDVTSKPSGNAGHINASHNDTTTSSGTSGLASDDAATDQAQAPPPSSGELVEAGAKAILLATDESPNRIGPHASAADVALGAAPDHVHSSAHATTAFSPGVIGARDQLASAIATATPEAAAITTLPSAQMTGAVIPSLGGDMHALQKHAA